MEWVYFYDHEGQLLKITDSRTPDDPTVIEYDEQGKTNSAAHFAGGELPPERRLWRQTLLQPTGPRTCRAVEAPPQFAMSRIGRLKLGSCDAHGEQVSRAVRLYDAQRRVSEVKQIMERPELMIREEIRNEVLANSGATLKQLRKHLLKMMAGGPSIAYTYDAEGRVTQTRSQSYGDERIAQTTYNERGEHRDRGHDRPPRPPRQTTCGR